MAVSHRRRSAHISLVILGAVALSGCGDNAQRRDLYASKQDCVRDWGDETKCETAPSSATGGRSGPHFWGPVYAGSSYRSGSSALGSVSSARAGSRAVGTSHVSRGGFGSSSSSHSSSGS